MAVIPTTLPSLSAMTRHQDGRRTRTDSSDDATNYVVTRHPSIVISTTFSCDFRSPPSRTTSRMLDAAAGSPGSPHEGQRYLAGEYSLSLRRFADTT